MSRVVRTHVCFNSVAFGETIYAQARKNKQTLADVARATGVHKSTLTRITYGKRPDANTLVALIHWGGWDIRQFMQESTVHV